jgi:hypothetical protein
MEPESFGTHLLWAHHAPIWWGLSMIRSIAALIFVFDVDLSHHATTSKLHLIKIAFLIKHNARYYAKNEDKNNQEACPQYKP